MVERSLSDGVALLQLNVPKVNALSPELCGVLRAAVDDAGSDPSVGAVVLASKVQGVFSAGLDLKALRGLGRDEMAAFAAGFFGLICSIRTNPVPMVAAVNGHAIAGGGLILCAADRRVAADDEYRIGLPEVGLALPLPTPLVEMVRDVLGPRSAREVLCFGGLHAPRRSLELGFVDRLVAPADLLEEAMGEAKQLAMLPQAALREMRRGLVGDLAARLAEMEGQGYPTFLDHWFSSDCRGARDAMLESLAHR